MATAKPKQYEIVLWEDPASNFEGWTAITRIDSADVDLVYSVGWPVREDDHFLWLAMDWHNDEANTLGKIPLTAIKARKVINLRGFPQKEKKVKGEGDYVSMGKTIDMSHTRTDDTP